jgi:MFS family permease
MATATIPVAYAVFNLVSAAAAIPAGRLSDAVGRRRIILLGWLVYALVYAGFALARSVWMVWVLYAAYGLYYAFAEGAAKALVAEVVAPASRGRAYGLYSAAVGVLALPASVIAGWLWDHVSATAPFFLGAGMALLGSICLILVPNHVSPVNANP